MTDLLKWIGELTAAGYDITATDGHTSRGDWNTNHPMPSLVILFRQSKKSDVVLKAYAVHARHWTIYATAFSGKAANRYHGIEIVGTRETEISCFEALQSFLGN